MSSAKITLYGMNRYFKAQGEDLLKYIRMPEGIDLDTVKNNIILKGAEFEVLYSDAYFFQDAVKVWSDKWYRTFEKWINALNIEYSPLENYDRIEDWTDNDSGLTHSNSTGSSTDTSSGTGNSLTENKVSAYNSGVYENDNTANIDTTNSTTGTTNLSNTGDITHNDTHTRQGRAHGNIGVTTSQQMLQSELDIAYWNLYDKISDLFLGEFTLPIY